MQTSDSRRAGGKPSRKECTDDVARFAFCDKFVDAVALVINHVFGPKIPPIDLMSFVQKAMLAFIMFEEKTVNCMRL